MTYFAIRTSPQRELALVGRYDKDGEWQDGILPRKGYVTFCPTETKFRKVMKRGRRTTRAVCYPTFVRYIFVRAPFSWLELMAEPHISGVVGFDGRPAPITDAEIERLKAMSGALVPHRRSVNPHKSFRAGEMVEIGYGPFSGQVVKIEGLHGRKAKVFVKLFGAVHSAEISVEDLEAA